MKHILAMFDSSDFNTEDLYETEMENLRKILTIVNLSVTAYILYEGYNHLDHAIKMIPKNILNQKGQKKYNSIKRICENYKNRNRGENDASERTNTDIGNKTSEV